MFFNVEKKIKILKLFGVLIILFVMLMKDMKKNLKKNFKI